MRIIILLLASAFALANTVNGQYVYFNNVYDLANSQNNSVATKLFLKNQLYLSFGNNIENGFYGSSSTQYNAIGELIGLFHYPLGYGYYTAGNGLRSEACLQLSDSGFVYLNTPEPCQDIFALVRYKQDLDTLWTRRYDDLAPSPCDDELFGWSIGELPNGNILVIGERKYTDLGLPDSTFKAYIEIDHTNGDVLQYHENEKTYDTFFLGSNKIDGFRVLDENTILHWGKTNHNPNNSPQRFVKKTDRYGNFIDSLQFGNPEFDERGFSALELLQGDSAVFMYMHSVNYLGGTSYTLKPRLVFIKVSTMEVLDEIEYEIPFIDANNWGSATFQSIIQTSDNHIVACYDYGSAPLGVKSGIAKFNPNGDIVWFNQYECPVGGAYLQYLYDLIEAPDGGYAAVGSIYETAESPSKQWLLKLDACGYEEPMGCPEVIVDGISESIRPTFVSWPNPFNQELKANLPDDAVLVEWLDMSGRIIHTEQVFYPKQSFNLAKLADGNYMMRVVMQDGTSSVKRVAKQ